MEPVYSKNNIPQDQIWESFRKKVPTNATRMEGPFFVATSEGQLHCEDGWLCIDARGYPYPVAADEFELIYEPCEPKKERFWRRKKG